MLLSLVVYLLPLVWKVENIYAINVLDSATETLNVNITHRKSSTSSISIEWDIQSPELIDKYHIRYQKQDSEAVSYSPSIEGNITEYEIQHLITNSLYDICIVATLFTQNGSTLYEKACVSLKTIPMIRYDSLIALLATIAYIVLTILFAYYIWKKRKAEYADQKVQASLDKASVGSSEKVEKEDNQRNYLLPPGQRPERLSIEDPDIPYITPPVSEIHDDSASELTVDYRENYN